MEFLTVTTEECANFPGGWSLNQEQMISALSNVSYDNKLRVLEFGSGEGTYVLARILTRRGIDFDYVAYETDEDYACTHPAVKTIMYSPDEFPTELHEGIYDLVVIDGPTGKCRTKWYPLLRDHVREGTIVLIDDFRHFPEFASEFRRHFKFDTIQRIEYPKEEGRAQITWKTVKIIKVRPLQS